MPDSKEVHSYPEAALFLWNGAASAESKYAESIEITVTDTIRKFLFPTTGVGYAARSQYVQTDRNVRLNIGQLHLGPSLFQLMNSAVNASSTLNFLVSADNATATYTIWSARCENFQLAGRERGIWRATTTWVSPDISGQ